jgi:hypothetical protein
MFTIVTLILFIALVLALAFHRHRQIREQSAYFDWLRKHISRFFKDPFLGQKYVRIKELSLWRYPVTEKWLLLCFVGSFASLVLSGFGYAFFSRHGLHGYPLLLHVFAGGVYAVSLCLVVISRAKRFSLEPRILSPEIDFSRIGDLSLSSSPIQKILFWTFVFGGFLLILSALSPMVPLLYFEGQKTMAEVHRYSALGSLLIAVYFSYLIVVDQKGS